MPGTGNTPREETIQMVQYYQENHKPAMEGDGLNVADWGWLHIDEVLNFLTDLKNNHQATGVRIYFGGHNRNLPEEPERYLGFNTAILVGTVRNRNGNQDLDTADFKDSIDYALSIGGGSQKFTDDLDRSHLHPPYDDDHGDDVLQIVRRRIGTPTKP